MNVNLVEKITGQSHLLELAFSQETNRKRLL